MTLIDYLGAVGLHPEEMPGVCRIEFLRTGPQEWQGAVYPRHSRLTKSSGKGIGPNVADALREAIIDHNRKQT